MERKGAERCYCSLRAHSECVKNVVIRWNEGMDGTEMKRPARLLVRQGERERTAYSRGTVYRVKEQRVEGMGVEG